MKKLTLNETEREILIYALDVVMDLNKINRVHVETAKILLVALKKL